MLPASYAPAISFLLVLLVLLVSGTALFAALHPHFVWRVFLGTRFGREAPRYVMLALRIGGILVGAAGVAFLLLSDA